MNSDSDPITPGFIFSKLDLSTSDYGMRADQPLGGSLQEGLALCHLGTLLTSVSQQRALYILDPQEMFLELIINLSSAASTTFLLCKLMTH